MKSATDNTSVMDDEENTVYVMIDQTGKLTVTGEANKESVVITVKAELATGEYDTLAITLGAVVEEEENEEA